MVDENKVKIEINENDEVKITDENNKEVLVELAQCPVCKSKNIEAEKQGFKAGRAFVGKTLLGPAGVLIGMFGQDDIKAECRDCGHKWRIKF